ncbi:hypothetical protein R9X47_03230 [Wukongibacter baidiensis]|uniref:hypothetical protein n=1 Tax=Wukongibacter baidiensis TaxID=1723361 RepID=UPI003D7F6123
MKKEWRMLTVAAIVSLSAITVSAYSPKIGDIIGQVFYTDIVTVIDGKTIPSVNIGGRTAIIVEDLSDYGYDVTWSNETRTLDVKTQEETKSNSRKMITGMVMLPEGKVAPQGGLEVELLLRLHLLNLPDGENGVPPFSSTTTKITIYEGNNFATYSIPYPDNFEAVQLEMKSEHKQKKISDSINVSDNSKNADFLLDIDSHK